MVKISQILISIVCSGLMYSCRNQANELKQVTVNDSRNVSHIFRLEGEPGYQGQVIWMECVDYIQGQVCNQKPGTSEKTAKFMEFRGALVQVLIDEEPDTLYGTYYEILGGIIANKDSIVCPKGDGVPEKLKECISVNYNAKDREFGYLRKAFDIVERTHSNNSSSSTQKPLSSNPDSSTPVAQIPQSSFVQQHGFLQAKNSRLYDEHGNIIRLWGMSLFWSGFDEGAAYYNANVVETLHNDWNVNLIRAAMQVDEGGRGYKIDRNEKLKIVKVVEAAIQQGIYVIVDWHTYNVVKEEAQEFFAEMAQLYGQVPNVIFEIFNEPVGVDWSRNVKPYGQEVIKKIRDKNARNLIIIGTKEYSANPQDAALDKINDSNLAYTLHFYAADHKEEYRQRALQAMNNGATVFVTEFGTCEASGNGRFDPDETERWIKFMAENGISWANWSISSKAETCSALKPGADTNGKWPDNQLTESGLWIRGRLREQRLDISTTQQANVGNLNKNYNKQATEGLSGIELLNGIRNIIGADNKLAPNEAEIKPFIGSFSTIKDKNDPNLSVTGYCMTDNACGRSDAYSRSDVPLSQLQCNKFCYIDLVTRKYQESKIFSIQNPPQHYLNCGWSTCN